MVPLIILLLLLVLVVFPLWAIIRIVALGNDRDRLDRQIRGLELEVRLLREQLSPRAAETVAKSGAETAPPVVAPPLHASEPSTTSAKPADLPPPVVTESAPPTFPEPGPEYSPPPPLAGIPPALPIPEARPLIPPLIARSIDEPVSEKPVIDWERFMGAKFFAWAGALAAFLGMAFFVKYSFEHDLIPPEVRVALGFLFAIGLVVGGLMVPRPRYLATAHTLCATGIVSLYAVTFACSSVYHFAFFGPLATFALMSLITATAFMLAVRMDAQVVAILGILGGFLTPLLLSTGRDNPAGLFGYVTLLNIGLIAVALRQRWHYLVALGAAGTLLMQLGWAEKFLSPAKATTAMIICLGMCALFLAAYFAGRKWDAENRVAWPFRWAAAVFPFVAFGFAAVFITYASVAARPGLLFGFVLLADLCLLALAWVDEEVPRLHLVAGAVVFALLAAWTGARLVPELLSWALALYLLYAILHSAFPMVLERHRPNASPTWWSQLFPPLALLLMMGPLFKLDAVSWLLWPCILIVDMLAVGLAFVSGSLAVVGAVLVLTLLATGAWLFRVPVSIGGGTEFLLVIGGFAVVFFVAGLWLTRRMAAREGESPEGPLSFGDARAQLPAFSVLLPFLLLILMTQRLALANPSPVFGLALLLSVLTLGLAYLLTLPWLPACALAGVAAVEYAWYARQAADAQAELALGWLTLFTGVFAIFPFVFRARFAALTGPWAAAALAPAVHFPLAYRWVERTWPNDLMGLLPATFAVIPLASLVAILRRPVPDEQARLNQLAWFGGVALLFITLIFPIQFERQWLTLAWAMEGVALLWLYHRVPHAGLRIVGVGLLVAAFVRLALNPAILGYQERTGTPIFNWYLYTYGLATACLWFGGWLLAPPRNRIGPVNGPALLNTLGVVLAFLLLNIEIADFFMAPGERTLAFQFSGHFARDMTYTIAWALFALALLLVSIWKTTRAGRFAALGLLGVALLKLFFHDLARLEALYRIGALFGVAVIAIVASVAYQRFLPGNEKSEKR